MSNSLTGITDYSIWNKDQSNISSIQNKIRKNEENKTFSQLLDENINSNSRININKLNKKEKKLYDACIEIESLLWKQVLNSMKKTIGKYKLIDGGQTEEIFTDFLYDEYSSMMAKRAQTDLADTIFKQFSNSL